MALLVNSDSLLSMASKEGYAVPAYNINNLEWARFILEACQEDKSPVILAVTEKSISYFGGTKVIYNMVKGLVDELSITIPVVLHLDHGSSVEICKKAIDSGFTSVMMDASRKSMQDNVSDTNEVISYAANKNVSVEAEIGVLNEEEGEPLENDSVTPEDAKEFVLQTGVSSLAPSVGNKHGIYKDEPKLDFELLGLICKSVKIPLVLHGASGLNDNMINTAIFCGVAKININTDLQIVWADAVRRFLDYNKKEYDPRVIIASGEQAIKKMVHYKNNLFGSKNRAV